MSEPFWSVECVDLHKSFGPDVHILRGLNLTFPEGMVTCVLGPSGTGKSVLLKHMIGLLSPDSGDLLVHGASVPKMRRSQILKMREKFGILFQDDALFGSMNVYDNVAFPLRQHTDLTEEEIAEIVDRRLDEVGLTNAAHRFPRRAVGWHAQACGLRARLSWSRRSCWSPSPTRALGQLRARNRHPPADAQHPRSG